MPNYLIETQGREYPVSAEELNQLDLRPVGNGEYHLLHGGKSYRVELLDLDPDAKTIRLRLNGREHAFRLHDATDQLIKKLGFSAGEAKKSKNVHAPMPGLVLKVPVAVGDPVAEGSTLLVLEAMKMENVLKAEGDGVVVAIHATEGEAVDKRQLLIEID